MLLKRTLPSLIIFACCKRWSRCLLVSQNGEEECCYSFACACERSLLIRGLTISELQSVDILLDF